MENFVLGGGRSLSLFSFKAELARLNHDLLGREVGQPVPALLGHGAVELAHVAGTAAVGDEAIANPALELLRADTLVDAVVMV